MNIDNQFGVPLAPADAWPLLMDVPRTAACFPGTSQIETVDADQYKGRVTVKLGPLTMVFAGMLRIEDRDDAAMRATVRARWSEIKGRGNAVTSTHFALHAQDSGTRVALHSELELAGQVAQYGRGAGMIAAVAEQLIAQFAQNLRARIDTADASEPHTADHAAPAISGLTLVAQAVRSQLKR